MSTKLRDVIANLVSLNLNGAAPLGNILRGDGTNYSDWAMPVVTGASGYFTLPNGVIVQWVTGTQDSSSGVVNQTGNWPIPFPSSCFIAIPSTVFVSIATATDIHEYQMASYTTSGWNVRRAQGGVYSGNAVTTPVIIAIGN
jgi:hypothetical protein